MPYIVISTNSVFNGKTIVGDKDSEDEELMRYLGAKLQRAYGSAYVCEEVPRVVLNKLKLRGYKVVAMAANETRCYWTLDKPDDKDY